jgi:hypothetical protein
MIKTYIRVEMSSEGESPIQIIERMRKIGAVPVVGDYDFELAVPEDVKIFDQLEEIHKALNGSKVRYTVTTRNEGSAEAQKKQVGHYAELKPQELRRAVYRAKLERWNEMGLDVAELEALLEQDLDKFKEASKKFLRTRLDHMSVITDRKDEDNVIDGQVLALLDETGRTLQDLISSSGFSEDQVTLSLGRLISSGSASRVQTDRGETYKLIPPPAPATKRRKTKKSE